MGNREERKKEIKKRIYDAAIDLFCDQGYESTSLIDIAQEAGVSTRTLYKYYPNKDAILRQFTAENLMATLKFSRDLPTSMSLKDKLLSVMVYDYEQMFCLFDMSFILHAIDEEEVVQKPFELGNFFVTESIYYDIIAQEQKARGFVPGQNTRLASTVLMGIYRHTCDLYRFSHHGRANQPQLIAMFNIRLNAIWPSIEHLVFTDSPDIAEADNFDEYVESLPVDTVFLEKYRKGIPGDESDA